MRALALALATAGGVGRAPAAPGTFGSALALLLYFPLAALGPLGYGLAALALLAAGIPAAAAAERVYGRRDDGRIVIDEVVGQLLALGPLLLAPPSRAVTSSPCSSPASSRSGCSTSGSRDRCAGSSAASRGAGA